MPYCADFLMFMASVNTTIETDLNCRSGLRALYAVSAIQAFGL